MARSDEVPVVGSQSPRPIVTGRRQSPVWVVMATVAVVALAMLGDRPDREPPNPANPPPLALPETPTVATWETIALRTDGFVRSITADVDGWLVVTSGKGIEVHTSPDAVSWTTTDLEAPPATVMAASAIVGSPMIVAGVDLATGEAWSWVSDGSDSPVWTAILVDRRVTALQEMSVVGESVYLAGSVAASGSGPVQAAVWRLEGERWIRLSDSDAGSSRSEVLAVVDQDDRAMAIGSVEDGLAVWKVAEDELVAAEVVGGSAVRPISVTWGRGEVTYAMGRDSGLRSIDLVSWTPAEVGHPWRVANAGGKLIGVGYDELSAFSSQGESVFVATGVGLVSSIAAKDGLIVAGGSTADTHTAVLWILHSGSLP